LYETARSRSPMPVTLRSSHVSSVTSGTSDWRKSVERSGSRPRARYVDTASSVFARSVSASWMVVRAW
jgi:hypothetical protein